MTSSRDDRPAFVFDMMELERPKMDSAVLTLLKSEALHPSDFTIRGDGVVRLNPEMAERIVGTMPGELHDTIGRGSWA